MLTLTQEEIVERFGKTAKCRVSYRNQRDKVPTTVDKVNWKYVVAVTMLFDEPKFYMNNGDACRRDGVRVVVKKSPKMRN